MIGSGLKKLAKEYGMTVSNGVAYEALAAMRQHSAKVPAGSGLYFPPVLLILQAVPDSWTL